MDREKLEQQLRNHFSSEVGEAEPSRNWWHNAVSHVVAQRHRSRWFGLMPKTRLAWALFLPLIVILLGGAVYGAGSLVSELFQKHAPQIEEAGLALPLDLSQTIDGVTVSLERAYVDANVALVGFTVSGPDEKYQPFFGKLSTADGQNLPGMIGMGVVPGSKAILGNWQSSERAAVIVSFDASSLKGTPSELSLILEVNNVADSPIIGESQIPAGPFRFEFNVPFHGGETVRIDQTVEAAGVPVTLEQVTISPWGVRAVLQTPDSKKYLPITSITLPSGDSVNGALSTHTEASIVKYFMGDFTGQTGEWTFTVKELVLTPESPTAGTHPASDTRRLAGPWVFRFDVP